MIRAQLPVLLLVFGCATVPDGTTHTVLSTRPEEHVLGLLVPDLEQASLTVLRTDVTAEHCGATVNSSGNLGTAVERALATVGGANVLINASVYTRQRIDRVCIRVRGDAAALY